jgi:Tfp pilus assembly protein PilF
VAAFRVLVAWLDQHGDAAEAVEAVLGLGLALDEGAEPGAAEEAYEDASARAERLGDGDLLARVLRNHALFCAEREHTERALALFDRARATATGAEAARTSIAFGIFRQHQGALDEAAELLRAGLGGLAPSDPDSLYARTELDAIELQRRARLSYDPSP